MMKLQLSRAQQQKATEQKPSPSTTSCSNLKTKPMISVAADKAPCQAWEAHLLRREEEGKRREEEGKRMLRELGTLRRELKTRLIKKGYVNTILVDPLTVCGAAASVSAAENMMSDMYHMKPAGQAKVAENIREVAIAWLLNKKRKSGKDDGPDPKRSRQEPPKAGPSGNAGGKGKSGSSAKRNGKGDKLF